MSRRWLTVPVLAVLLVVGSYHAWLWSAALGDLPKAIGVRWIRDITIDPGFPTWLITDTSGFVLYELDDRTIADLERSGLASLRDARIPRDGDREHARRHYQPWSETPLPPQWTRYTPEGGELFSGLVYGHWSAQFERRFLEAARSPGSFYSMNGHGDVLLVMPKLRLAVFTWAH